MIKLRISKKKSFANLNKQLLGIANFNESIDSEIFISGDLDSFTPGRVYFRINGQGPGTVLAEKLAYRFLEPRVTGQTKNISFPLLGKVCGQVDLKSDEFLNRLAQFRENVFVEINESENEQYDIELEDFTELYNFYYDMLNTIGEVVDMSDEFTKELNGIIRGLENYQSKNRIEEDGKIFFLLIAHFYLNSWKTVPKHYLEYRFSVNSQVSKLMNSYIKRIKKYKIKLTHNSSKKSNVVLIPTSLDDQYDINTINKLEQNLNEKHQITILYPNIKNYCSIEALIEKDTNIKEGDAICFMGHGSETMGIEVILNSPQKKYLNFDNLLSIIQNSKGKDLTLILLACDLVYYDKFRNKFMASGLNNRVNFIYSSSSFSFWKMEIFMAGFCRGLELGMSYFNCYQYGKDFIDFRGLLGYKLQFEPLQVDKENILHN